MGPVYIVNVSLKCTRVHLYVKTDFSVLLHICKTPVLAVFVTYYSQGIIASGLLCITKYFSVNISVIH